MSKSVKKLISIFTILFLLALSYASYLYFAPVKKIANQKTDIKLTQNQLLLDFNTDKLNASSKYKNKIIELKATVKKTQIKDSLCSIIIDDGGNFIIIATCVNEIKNEVKALNEGDNIIIKGIYSGFVILDDDFFIPAEIKIDKCTLVK